MCDLNGDSVAKLEDLGVRVRLVHGLGEGALFFRKRALALLDEDLRNEDRDDALDWIFDEVASRLVKVEPAHPHLTPLA